MAFKKRDPVRRKIETDNKITKQLISFNFLGHLISYEKVMDIDNVLNNNLEITGISYNVFRPYKTVKKTRLKLYYALALPALQYGSENWNIKARDARRIRAAWMKCIEKNRKLHLDRLYKKYR